jgi:hypothetical protein
MVASTDPTNNENNVVLNKLVSVTFNMPMKAGTITGTTIYFKTRNCIAGIVSIAEQQLYLLYSSIGCKYSLYSNCFSSRNKPRQHTFTKWIRGIYDWNYSSPTVTSDPISNATGVALNKTITANFSGNGSINYQYY